jgi:hypothetical protein
LVHAGRPGPVQEIVNVPWGDAPPDTAVNVVQRHIGALRRLLEPDLPPRGDSRWLVREPAVAERAPVVLRQAAAARDWLAVSYRCAMV